MEIRTRQELDYVMRFYGITKVPTFDGRTCCGSIVRGKDGKLSYTYRDFCPHWRTESYAFQAAFHDVNGMIELSRRINEKVSVTAVESVDRQVWDYPDVEGGPVRHHVYPKTVTTKTETTWEGTLDEVFVRMENARRTFRYCNGYSHSFKDPHVGYLHGMWYETLDYGRGIDLFYGGLVYD